MNSINSLANRNRCLKEESPSNLQLLKSLEVEFPREPFPLSPFERVLSPDKYFEALRKDVEAGPKWPRAKTGALRDDLLRLCQKQKSM